MFANYKLKRFDIAGNDSGFFGSAAMTLDRSELLKEKEAIAPVDILISGLRLTSSLFLPSQHTV
jgi:hypothetical protein